VRTVGGDDARELGGGMAESLVPGAAAQGSRTAAAELRPQQAVLPGGGGVEEGPTLGAEHALAAGMILVAAELQVPVLTAVDDHAAADHAVAAGGSDTRGLDGHARALHGACQRTLWVGRTELSAPQRVIFDRIRVSTRKPWELAAVGITGLYQNLIK